MSEKGELDDPGFLGRRLTVALATPIIVLIALGLALGRQLVQMAEDAAWVEHTDQVISTANETLLHVVDQETSLRAYLMTRERVFLDPYLQAHPREGFDRLQQMVADSVAQQRAFGEARRAYEDWHALVAPAIEAENFDESRTKDAMLDRKRQMDRVREAMGEAIKREESLRQTRTEVARASTESTKRAFIGLLVSVAALLAFLSRQQLGAIAKTFGAALRAEKATRAQMEIEAWLREGQARLALTLQGEKTTSQLAADCLAMLVEYTGADVAAFFVRDGAVWRRIAAVALDARAASADTFPDGEGVIGRAANAGQVVELRELPANFLQVRTATGETGPTQVLILPARNDRTTAAVVELGYLRPPEPKTRQLMERIGESIALAIRSAEYKERLRVLLEETQRQGEELQTQGEEMKVQNEELEERTRALQDSQGRLQNQQAELEQINSQLEEQTQALSQQRDDLARSQGELRKANEYKSEFLANMSHELRTPLNSSLILAKLLATNRHGHLDDEEVKFAETIYSAGNDLLTLINDILDLSKIEAGKLDVRAEAIPLARLADELGNTFRPIADDRRLSLQIEVQKGTPPEIVTDPMRLQQILKNLLSNAFKFTERGGVSLTVRPTKDGGLAFEVKDTGIGIAPEQHQVIFEAFRQADGTTNRKYGGTGLGLSISRDLAHLLGGDLSLESAPGRGSTFSLVLPVSMPERPAAAPLHATTPVPAPPTRVIAPRAPPAGHAPAATGAAAVVAARAPEVERGAARTILVIEDDPAFAKVIADLAAEMQFHAAIAVTAEDGLTRARRDRPSAILLDVVLPDRSGLSVLDALKHDPSTRHIPVHMISASDHTRAALEMGAAGYAIKPIAREELAGALRRLEAKMSQDVRRILVIEDDDVHRESTCKLLASPGVETTAVGTAKAALEALSRTTFDCMVLDLSLPDRTGFELLEEMSQKDQYGFPPVIVYTGRALSREEEQQLRRFSQSIIIKGARSPERLLDEVTLFLHQVEADLPVDRQRMLRDARSREAAFEGRRVLVVEDDVRNIFALKSVLEPKGAKVDIARNGREALDQVRGKASFDLVLMDIMMPEMDGLQATREIRKMPEHAKLPIIALTAKAMSDDREQCLAAGANDYISKPLDVDKLLSLARVWMPR